MKMRWQTIPLAGAALLGCSTVTAPNQRVHSTAWISEHQIIDRHEEKRKKDFPLKDKLGRAWNYVEVYEQDTQAKLRVRDIQQLSENVRLTTHLNVDHFKPRVKVACQVNWRTGEEGRLPDLPTKMKKQALIHQARTIGDLGEAAATKPASRLDLENLNRTLETDYEMSPQQSAAEDTVLIEEVEFALTDLSGPAIETE